MWFMQRFVVILDSKYSTIGNLIDGLCVIYWLTVWNVLKMFVDFQQFCNLNVSIMKGHPANLHDSNGSLLSAFPLVAWGRRRAGSCAATCVNLGDIRALQVSSTVTFKYKWDIINCHSIQTTTKLRPRSGDIMGNDWNGNTNWFPNLWHWALSNKKRAFKKLRPKNDVKQLKLKH